MKRQLRSLVVSLILLFGSMLGAPMRPEDIEKLMHDMNRQRVVVSIPGDPVKPE